MPHIPPSSAGFSRITIANCPRRFDSPKAPPPIAMTSSLRMPSRGLTSRAAGCVMRGRRSHRRCAPDRATAPSAVTPRRSSTLHRSFTNQETHYACSNPFRANALVIHGIRLPYLGTTVAMPAPIYQSHSPRRTLVAPREVNMERRRFVTSVLAGSLATPLLAAGQHDHGDDVDGPLANVEVSFGQWHTSPSLDRFPNNSPITANV